MKLTPFDLSKIVGSLPDRVKTILETNDIFLAGGSILSILKDQEVKDYDFFGPSAEKLETAMQSCHTTFGGNILKTKNAITLKMSGEVPYQVITRWLFNTPEEVCDSFDFALCRAVVFYDKLNKRYDSVCDDDFYYDFSMNQISYKHPVRDEDSAGSLLRAFKYAAKGYKVPKETVAACVSRMIVDVHKDSPVKDNEQDEKQFLWDEIEEQFNFAGRGNY